MVKAVESIHEIKIDKNAGLEFGFVLPC